jgi:signal peptidase complex subunit 2
VRLALGWTGVLIAGVTALYSYRLEYEKSKPVVWIGLIACVLARDHTCCSFSLSILHLRYIALSLSQALYAYFIEGDTVFVGKRKTFDKRVSVPLAGVRSSFVLTIPF